MLSDAEGEFIFYVLKFFLILYWPVVDYVPGFLVDQMVKNPPAVETWVLSHGVGKMPWRRMGNLKLQQALSLRSHGQSLGG